MENQPASFSPQAPDLIYQLQKSRWQHTTLLSREGTEQQQKNPPHKLEIRQCDAPPKTKDTQKGGLVPTSEHQAPALNCTSASCKRLLRARLCVGTLIRGLHSQDFLLSYSSPKFTGVKWRRNAAGIMKSTSLLFFSLVLWINPRVQMGEMSN